MDTKSVSLRLEKALDDLSVTQKQIERKYD